MGIVRRGVHQPLEQAADRMIADSLKGVTKFSDKSDILTPWKEDMRRSREVLVRSGTPDPAVRNGMYHRAANPSLPHLNSRDGTAFPRRRNINGSLRAHVEENGRDFDQDDVSDG